ncbi:MAG: patatin-like phospholipase family protein, partial [Xanthomonadales bacterium]|nr:patatin-like phospholipase family protein [Xanthomonadales bacterium]
MTAASTDQTIERLLEHYFRVDIASDDPLLDELELIEIAGGEWLMHQGDPGDALYLLVRGRLQARSEDPAGKQPSRFLNEIVPGDSVGEISLLTGAPRAVGIQAIRDSLLLRIDQEQFRRLAESHPALVMRLATNVANLLQSSHGRKKSSTRNLRTISLLPLGASQRHAEFCRQLTDQLGIKGATLVLTPERLGELGAPLKSLAPQDAVPDALKAWLHDQEEKNRFLVFLCAPEDTPWTRFVLRQSDMVLLVGDALQDPVPRPWEERLAQASEGIIARRLLVLLQPPAATPIQGTGQWLTARRPDFHVHVRQDCPDDAGRVTRIVAGEARGLVLAGGAARGFAHLGVYRAMSEAGLNVDWIGGTSLGAIMAAVIASPVSLDEGIDLARESFVKGKPFSDFTLPLISLIRGRRMRHLLRKHLDYRIEDLPMPFFCVSCNLDDGSMNLHERGSLVDAICATAAIPGILPPALVNRRLAIDGAVINNLPIDIMQQKPVGEIFAVDLSSQKQYQMDFEHMPSPWAILKGRYLPFAPRYRLPGLTTIM